MSGPLAGKRVVITRSTEQSSSLRTLLEGAGSDVLELPLIRVHKEWDQQTAKDIFREIATYEWMVFTSPNGVRYFFEIFFEQFDDIRCFGPARIACVGETTASVVREWHLQVDLVPEQANANALADALIKTDSLDNANVLVVTGNRNREELIRRLEVDGFAIVDRFPVYRTDLNDLSQIEAAQRFRKEGADALLFCSSSSVESFVKQAEALQVEEGAARPKVFSIGPQTTETIIAKGMPLEAQSEEATLKSLVKLLEEKL